MCVPETDVAFANVCERGERIKSRNEWIHILAARNERRKAERLAFYSSVISHLHLTSFSTLSSYCISLFNVHSLFVAGMSVRPNYESNQPFMIPT